MSNADAEVLREGLLLIIVGLGLMFGGCAYAWLFWKDPD